MAAYNPSPLRIGPALEYILATSRCVVPVVLVASWQLIRYFCIVKTSLTEATAQSIDSEVTMYKASIV